MKYFRRNRHRMRYTALKEQGLPIGSGVTEAACKTLAATSLPDMIRWSEPGDMLDGADSRHRRVPWGINNTSAFRRRVLVALSRRSLRATRCWISLLAHTYKAEVTTLDNVVPIRSWQ